MLIYHVCYFIWSSSLFIHSFFVSPSFVICIYSSIYLFLFFSLFIFLSFCLLLPLVSLYLILHVYITLWWSRLGTHLTARASSMLVLLSAMRVAVVVCAIVVGCRRWRWESAPNVNKGAERCFLLPPPRSVWSAELRRVPVCGLEFPRVEEFCRTALARTPKKFFPHCNRRSWDVGEEGVRTAHEEAGTAAWLLSSGIKREETSAAALSVIFPWRQIIFIMKWEGGVLFPPETCEITSSHLTSRGCRAALVSELQETMVGSVWQVAWQRPRSGPTWKTSAMIRHTACTMKQSTGKSNK